MGKALLLFLTLTQVILIRALEGECGVEPGCPDQGEYLGGVWGAYDLDPAAAPVQGADTCVFRRLQKSLQCLQSYESSFATRVLPSSPDTQWWSRCQHCGWSSAGRFHIYNQTSNGEQRRVVDLSVSLWGEFFFEFQNDFLQAEVRDSREEEAPLYFVDRPVFLLPLISLHPGHVLVDVLQQVYGAMIKAYGRVRRDSLLVLDVAGGEERSILDKKIYLNTRNDSFVSVLNVLSDLPVVSVEALTSLPGGATRILFQDIHIGLDNAEGFFHHGHLYHPCTMAGGGHSALFRDLSARYQQFQSYIHSFYGRSPTPRGEMEETAVTFVQRSLSLHKSMVGEVPSVEGKGDEQPSNRLMLNVASLADLARDRGHQVTTLTLEDEPFTSQLQILHQTDVLVAMAGSALHNMLFMKRGSSVVIIMQKGWRPWAWMFANQALLLGMRVFVYVDDSGPLQGSQCITAHWSRLFWRVGPRAAKSANVHVDEEVFARILDEAGDFSVEGKGSYQRRVTAEGETEGCLGGVRSFSNQNPRSEGGEYGEALGLGCVSKVEGSEVPTVRVLVSAVKIERGAQEWQASLMGAFEYYIDYDGDTTLHEFFASMPHLSLCVHAIDSGMELPACLPLDSFNYYSELRLRFEVSAPLQSLHIWLQATPQGGKLLGSDTFVALDLRVPEGGWLLSQHREHSGLTVGRSPCGGEESMSVNIVGPSGQNERVLFFSLLSPWDFQRDVSTQCLSESLTPQTCARIVAAVAARLEQCHLSTTLGLPSVQQEPSHSSPFVFLHIEKTGGTTLREFITEASELRGLKSLVPCHGGVHCTVLDPSDLFHSGQEALLQEVAVVAGHFFWGVWKKLPHWNIARITSPSPPSSSSEEGEVPHLLVMGRHPVDRAISYYYQRCYQVEHCRGYQRMINSLRPDELLQIGLNERHGQYSPLDPSNNTVILLDEGMSDASCRVLSGRRATSGYTRSLVGIDVDIEGEGKVPTTLSTPGPLPPEALQEAVRHLGQCVVGLQERWSDTLAVLQRWFPWMAASLDNDTRKMHLFSGKEDRYTLLPELKSVLESINQCDLALYEAMEQRFDRQMQVLEARFVD